MLILYERSCPRSVWDLYHSGRFEVGCHSSHRPELKNCVMDLCCSRTFLFPEKTALNVLLYPDTETERMFWCTSLVDQRTAHNAVPCAQESWCSCGGSLHVELWYVTCERTKNTGEPLIFKYKNVWSYGNGSFFFFFLPMLSLCRSTPKHAFFSLVYLFFCVP